MNIVELKELVSLTSIIFTNNFTKESNYIFFHESGKLWASNSTNTIGTDECLLIHEFTNPIFSNVGILAKELMLTVKNLSDDVEIYQKEDHILIVEGKVTVKIRTIPYTSCPVKVSLGVEYNKIGKKIGEYLPALTEFMDKAEEVARNIHFDTFTMTSTDVVSVHRITLQEGMVSDEPFSVGPHIASLFDSFDYISIGEYLYLKRECGTTLITRCGGCDEFPFIDNIVWRTPGIPTPNIADGELLKLFMSDIKKPDREFIVSIIGGIMSISAEDGRKGGVRIETDVVLEEDINTEFKINADKFISICKNYEKFSLDGNVLICYDGVSSKYVSIKEV
jgi:hypothetical protein